MKVQSINNQTPNFKAITGIRYSTQFAPDNIKNFEIKKFPLARRHKILVQMALKSEAIKKFANIYDFVLRFVYNRKEQFNSNSHEYELEFIPAENNDKEKTTQAKNLPIAFSIGNYFTIGDNTLEDAYRYIKDTLKCLTFQELMDAKDHELMVKFLEKQDAKSDDQITEELQNTLYEQGIPVTIDPE